MPPVSKLNFLPTTMDLDVSMDVTLTFNIIFSILWDKTKNAPHPNLLDRLLAHVGNKLTDHLGPLTEEDVAHIRFSLPKKRIKWGFHADKGLPQSIYIHTGHGTNFDDTAENYLSPGFIEGHFT